MGGGTYLANAGVFLVKTIFGLYILAVMLRFLLAWVRADFYNPISQFLVRITNPALIPLRRIVPPVARIDTASLVLMLALQLLELMLAALIAGIPLQLASLLVLAVAELLGLLLHVFLFSILIQVILSWVNPGAYNPATALLYRLNEPLLGPARRLIPPMGGLDLSPLVVMVCLQLLSMLVVAPLSDLGWQLALR